MQKQAPSVARLLTMVLFMLSCFGLLLFLWLSFGGSIPLNPEGYKFRARFAEATTLSKEADVRMAGVSVGKVRLTDHVDNANVTDAEIELEPRFAPIAADARAILRQKTLLGETYVEITPGTKGARTLREGELLASTRVAPTVELDEIFDALDPKVRESFRDWQQEFGRAIEDSGKDLNNALGNLPPFVADAADVLETLDSQESALTRLVRNTGIVFGALNENESQLRSLITSADTVFAATQSRNDALAEAIRIFPTFLDESKLTFERLTTFADDTQPLVRDLRPVARDLRPTLRDLRALSPDLERVFEDLDPLIVASRRGLPATSEVLRGLRPVLAELAPFLGQVNPILEFLELSQHQVSDFMSQGGAAVANTTATNSGTGHYLRQFGPVGVESAAIFRERVSTNRGNSYIAPKALHGAKGGRYFLTPSWDCKNAGGEKDPDADSPGCHLPEPIPLKDGTTLTQRFPHQEAADYGG